ncbi:TPA: HNH endonuclease [Salmonella enterica subsp. enterica serovar Enteritidis]|uniref:HNH endonuclease n=1 Tax=Salmonella enterica TaxID=28901 RepID=UPI0010707974|nr:HNH endonuclease [Salmonella enterica]ECF1703904.1 HNH endonuclease [Salmonella enterica subsp. enterica]EDP9826696.1 HNH endonuclease [Salmonella enterica subsp. enterica]HAE4698311.1 HNH endonuclease [Salmonella enterica subsp. enterica serovar Enteritidis]HAU6875049.1 HNH endonuclease [Salmonella enterica subsp. enterica serovar Enteritidis]
MLTGTEKWLSGAGKGLGAPVPQQVADKLRGKTFGNFDKFRAAFWESVANCPELNRQFSKSNVTRMQSGKAPKVRKVDRAGKRGSFELHHTDEIAKGGDVYNVDNLRVNTPKNHIDLHR